MSLILSKYQHMKHKKGTLEELCQKLTEAKNQEIKEHGLCKTEIMSDEEENAANVTNVTDVPDASTTNESADLNKETQAYETEFVKTYERLPILWNVNHPDYTNKYRRGAAIDILVNIMKKWDQTATKLTVRRKINILRSCYRKDLRKHLASKYVGHDGEVRYEHVPKNWKFHALKFLGGQVSEDFLHTKNISIEEINLDSTNFEDEDSEGLGNDGTSSCSSNTLHTNGDKTHKLNYSEENCSRKRAKIEPQNYLIDGRSLAEEFEAIGSNVVCKLKRMSPEQRCRAELLINKVLIEGLKYNLTDDTDLTEVYK